MANDKIFSVRTDEETLERLNKLVEESGMKKSDLLPVLLSAWETQEMKTRLPGRADDIEAFDTLIGQLRTSYLNNIQLSILAKETAQKEQATELEIKTRTISDLQNKTDDQQNTINELQNTLKTMEKEFALLQKESQEQKESIADKEKLIQSLTSNVAHLQAQVDEAKDFSSIKEELSASKTTIAKLQNQIESERKEHDHELKEKLLEVKADMQSKLAEAQENYIQRIQHMQDKFAVSISSASKERTPSEPSDDQESSSSESEQQKITRKEKR